MKKRLRKKRRLGEFREWGCVVDIALKSPGDLDRFLDIFVEWVEDLDCYCGGGGAGTSLSMMVELGRRDREPASLRARLLERVESCPLVSAVSATPLFDMWHGSEPPVNPSQAT
jgi:uncharacterized protein YggL (DUF469 family)